MIDFKKAREDMVETQLRARGIKDSSVLKAMQAVPRERFIDPAHRSDAYADSPLPIRGGQTISQPYIVASMLESLYLSEGDKLLDVGSGCGYAAAVASRIVAKVIGVERVQSLYQLASQAIEDLGYRNIELEYGDAHQFVSQPKTYDALQVAAAADDIPKEFLNCLTIGGRMVLPVNDPTSGGQNLLRITRDSEIEFLTETITKVRFVPLLRSVEPQI